MAKKYLDLFFVPTKCQMLGFILISCGPISELQKTDSIDNRSEGQFAEQEPESLVEPSRDLDNPEMQSANQQSFSKEPPPNQVEEKKSPPTPVNEKPQSNPLPLDSELIQIIEKRESVFPRKLGLIDFPVYPLQTAQLEVYEQQVPLSIQTALNPTHIQLNQETSQILKGQIRILNSHSNSILWDTDRQTVLAALDRNLINALLGGNSYTASTSISWIKTDKSLIKKDHDTGTSKKFSLSEANIEENAKLIAVQPNQLCLVNSRYIWIFQISSESPTIISLNRREIGITETAKILACNQKGAIQFIATVDRLIIISEHGEHQIMQNVANPVTNLSVQARLADWIQADFDWQISGQKILIPTIAAIRSDKTVVVLKADPKDANAGKSENFSLEASVIESILKFQCSPCHLGVNSVPDWPNSIPYSNWDKQQIEQFSKTVDSFAPDRPHFVLEPSTNQASMDWLKAVAQKLSEGNLDQPKPVDNTMQPPIQTFSINSFVGQYCISCHAKYAEMPNLLAEFNSISNSLLENRMPPVGTPQAQKLTQEEKQLFIQALQEIGEANE